MLPATPLEPENPVSFGVPAAATLVPVKDDIMKALEHKIQCSIYKLFFSIFIPNIKKSTSWL
jgi:hypothetical protein